MALVDPVLLSEAPCRKITVRRIMRRFVCVAGVVLLLGWVGGRKIIRWGRRTQADECRERHGVNRVGAESPWGTLVEKLHKKTSNFTYKHYCALCFFVGRYT